MPFPDRPLYEDIPGRRWKLVRGLDYEGETQVFRIPAGYVTDFASVPRAFVWLVLPYGPYTRAAVLHDWLITDELSKAAPALSSRDVDGMFRRVMREEGTPFAVRWVMWGAVRLAAPFSPDRRKGLGLLRDLPALALVAAPALFTLPAALAVALTLAFFWPLMREKSDEHRG